MTHLDEPDMVMAIGVALVGLGIGAIYWPAALLWFGGCAMATSWVMAQ